LRSATKHLLREGVLWSAGLLAVVAGIYFFNDLKAALAPQGEPMPSLASLTKGEDKRTSGFSGEVRLKGNGSGHFVFEGAVNNRPLTFMADTGATIVALTYDDAKRVGLSPHGLDFNARVETANGIARVAPVTLDRVRIGDITVRNVRAAVAEKGALATNLLGMTFLGRLGNFQVRGNELILTQ
jgi:aspartyl protease family protein